ncbi:NACHT, LRR and PYD domains-containing protein 12 isoform X6 [Silurus meridionalis]|nr:NACHT, LRR and PYD domains-containing protein 12 isoform X6 [Silurus meridionalis]
MKEQRKVLKQNQVWRILLDVLKQNQDCRTLLDVHRSAVDQSLKSQTGHLDLFLRFLLGLSLESNQKLLHSFITQTGSSSQNKEETVQYIKKKISEDLSTEKSINLFHCLNELGDDSLVEEIQQYLKSGAQSELSPSQWSALVFVLLTSAQDLEEFDLNKYNTPDKIRDKILVRVMPVFAASRKAITRCSDILGRSGKALTSVLNSETSSLRELHLTVNTLNLSGNKLEDSGVKRLSALLENPECKVKDLRLGGCGVSDEGCAALASALRSNPSHLRDLDLSWNKVGDSGVKCLSAVLENPYCKLETLRLYSCGVSDEGCAALASALRSNPLHLKDLDLDGNKVGDSGVTCLSAVLENSHCKLEILRLEQCGVSDEGCSALASALRSNPSHMRVLNLTKNNVGDSGVKCLSAVLENPNCKLEILRKGTRSLTWLRCKESLSTTNNGEGRNELMEHITLFLREEVVHAQHLEHGFSDTGALSIGSGAQIAQSGHSTTLNALQVMPCEPQAQTVAQRSTNDITTPEKSCSAKPDQEKPCSAELDLKRPCQTDKVTVDSGAVLELPAI